MAESYAFYYKSISSKNNGYKNSYFLKQPLTQHWLFSINATHHINFGFPVINNSLTNITGCTSQTTTYSEEDKNTWAIPCVTN